MPDFKVGDEVLAFNFSKWDYTWHRIEALDPIYPRHGNLVNFDGVGQRRDFFTQEEIAEAKKALESTGRKFGDCVAIFEGLLEKGKPFAKDTPFYVELLGCEPMHGKRGEFLVRGRMTQSHAESTLFIKGAPFALPSRYVFHQIRSSKPF